jgi:hypothetical protein
VRISFVTRLDTPGAIEVQLLVADRGHTVLPLDKDFELTAHITGQQSNGSSHCVTNRKLVLNRDCRRTAEDID